MLHAAESNVVAGSDNGYEPVDASVTFDGFMIHPESVDCARTIVITPPAQPSNAPKLEFIGDSITAGMGDVGDNAVDGTCTASPPIALQDWDMTWAAETCRQLGAVCHAEAWSGRGMLRNYGDGAPDDPRRDSIKMPALWRQTLGSEPAGDNAQLNRWDTHDFRPDAVLINLGTSAQLHFPATGCSLRAHQLSVACRRYVLGRRLHQPLAATERAQLLGRLHCRVCDCKTLMLSRFDAVSLT